MTWDGVIERSPRGRIAVLGGIAAALPAAGAAAAEGAWRLGLAGLAGLAVLVAIAAWRRRVRILTLPLEISPHALASARGPHAVYRFRVRLGRGRTMRDAAARVLFVDGDGTETPLTPVLAVVDALVGPWTIAVVDRDGVVRPEGRLRIEVTAREGGAIWRDGRAWPVGEVRGGTFAAPVRAGRGGLELAPTWDEVVTSA
jgi:hypothetical protein